MLVVRLLAVAPLLALAGCHPNCTSPDGGCGATSDCQQGQVCVGTSCSPDPCRQIVIKGTGAGICGFCVNSQGAPCQDGSDCPPGFGCLESIGTCSAGTCMETFQLQDGGTTTTNTSEGDAGPPPVGTCQTLF